MWNSECILSSGSIRIRNSLSFFTINKTLMKCSLENSDTWKKNPQNKTVKLLTRHDGLFTVAPRHLLAKIHFQSKHLSIHSRKIRWYKVGGLKGKLHIFARIRMCPLDKNKSKVPTNAVTFKHHQWIIALLWITQNSIWLTYRSLHNLATEDKELCA